MVRCTRAGARIRIYSAAGLGKIGGPSGQSEASDSPKKPGRMSDKKLARRLCGADCRRCAMCEYGREWLRRQENSEA